MNNFSTELSSGRDQYRQDLRRTNSSGSATGARSADQSSSESDYHHKRQGRQRDLSMRTSLFAQVIAWACCAAVSCFWPALESTTQAAQNSARQDQASSTEGTNGPSGQKRYPHHWGEPPRRQTRDLRPLPGGYGRGSSTLAKWIQENLDRDALSPSVPVSDAPLVMPRGRDGSGRLQITGTLQTWHKLTLEIDGPYAHEQDNAPNPFTDVRFQVEFVHEDGAPHHYIVPGYFAADGDAANSSAESGTIWRAHFASDKAGRWQYQVVFERGPLAALDPEAEAVSVSGIHGARGSFEVSPSDKQGRDLRAHGRLRPAGQRYLQFAGTGKSFLKFGADAPETLLAYADFDNTLAGNPRKSPLKTWQPHLRDWADGDPQWKDGRGRGLIGAVNYLSGKGCNAFSFLTYNAGGDGDNVWPFIHRDDKLHYDCSKLDQWGIVFDHATTKGMYLHFKMQETENDDHRRGKQQRGSVPESLDGGRLGPQRMLYCRELIARFGHNLALNWNLGEENTQSTAEQQAMIDYIAMLDAYGHNIVVHTYPDQQDAVYRPLLGNNSRLTGISLQNSHIRDTHWQTVKWVRASTETGKPWIVAFDESGSAAHGQCPDLGYEGFDGRDRDGEMIYTEHDIRRQTLWGHLMGGGAGVEYYFGYKFAQNDLLCEDWRSRDRSWEYGRIALEFFHTNDIPLPQMMPADELVGAGERDNSRYCLAQPGQVYVVFLAEGQPVELDLTGQTGQFAIQWFNPRSGGQLMSSKVQTVAGGGQRGLGQPPTEPGQDWVVLVRRATESQAAADPLQRDFRDTVRPFLKTYCQDCHGADTQEAKLDLSLWRQPSDAGRAHQTLHEILHRVEAGEMPPADATPQPTPQQRQALTEWIRQYRRAEAERHAGDPGLVLARRLSNAEYNHAVRDLTGIDIRPTQTFPVDPANEAGFDNSGESLTMSPALLRKYLEAARMVVEHMVLLPDGITFAPHPVMTNTDRDKFAVKRIVEFYQRQPTDLAEYFLAAWQWQHRLLLTSSRSAGGDRAVGDEVTIAELEQELSQRVSLKYLKTIRETLNRPSPPYGPIAELQRMWQRLPSPPADAQTVRRECERMRDYVVGLRRQLEPTVENLKHSQIHLGSQTFVLWKNRQYVANRRRGNLEVLQPVETDGDASRVLSGLEVPAEPAARRACEDEFRLFCSVFPDRFYVSERGRDYLDKPREQQERGRLLSAGFHSMMGYFRDDQPLYEMILDEQQQAELDRLWQELDFVTSAPMRQYKGFVWFERTDSRYMRDPEFDFARSEDKDVTSRAKIRKLGELYLAKAQRTGADEVQSQAIRDYFRDIDRQIRAVEDARGAAELLHLEQVLAFASRAFRRPLTKAERVELQEFYRQLRTVDELSHEEAVQDVVVAILMSPHFFYRVDLASAGDGTRPLTDLELASRLSFFLWASQPDAELLEHAVAGELHQPQVLMQQTRRMLRDPKVRGLATEFAGNWLDFRRFEEHNSVDRTRFPAFTDELRSAMFEEPVRFFVDVAQRDRSVLDFLYAHDTFVNRSLAAHYGLKAVDLKDSEWIRVGRQQAASRGGLLTMSVFLTQNSPGLRTSPVKRGYWVVRRLLGERIPAPPPNVPELPADETQLGELTLPQMLARHREHQSCAGCHNRFDSIGLAFEGFGPVGEARSKDLGGRPVQTEVEFPSGATGQGVDGLREYIRQHRERDFTENLARKLLAYALGRTLQLSDELLIEQLQSELTDHDHRFGWLIERIVTSPQFLTKRGSGMAVPQL